MGALKPVPIGTEFRLRIWGSKTRCELQGRVIYLHSGNTLGISGMGVLFGDMAADQRSVIDAWLQELAQQASYPTLLNSVVQVRREVGPPVRRQVS